MHCVYMCLLGKYVQTQHCLDLKTWSCSRLTSSGLPDLVVPRALNTDLHKTEKRRCFSPLEMFPHVMLWLHIFSWSICYHVNLLCISEV